MSKILPDKPSELFELALKDFEWVETHPQEFVVNMSNWLLPGGEDSLCSVCLAGAVMARTLNLTTKADETSRAELTPSMCLSSIDAAKMHALNYLRDGRVFAALYTLNEMFYPLDSPISLQLTTVLKQHAAERHEIQVICHAYDASPSKWWDDMRAVMDQLKALDL